MSNRTSAKTAYREAYRLIRLVEHVSLMPSSYLWVYEPPIDDEYLTYGQVRDNALTDLAQSLQQAPLITAQAMISYNASDNEC